MDERTRIVQERRRSNAAGTHGATSYDRRATQRDTDREIRDEFGHCPSCKAPQRWTDDVCNVVVDW